MTIEAGPNIVNSGLVLSLDAANSKSYPGSGTTWTDLSGNGNNGTLINSPTYNSSNSGFLTFNGTNTYVLLPTNLISWVSNPFTVSIWFRTSSNGVIFGQESTSTPAASGGYVPAINVDAGGILRTSCFWGGAVSNQSSSSFTVNNNTWGNVVVTVSSTTHISYFNGVQFATLSKTQTGYATDYFHFIGAGNAGGGWSTAGNYFNGSISNFMHYNRALSASEISQNFNALRGRYGI